MFANRLALYRKVRKETQDSLAMKVYVSRSLIAKWEQGRAIPSRDQIGDLARILDVEIDDLIKGTELDNFSNDISLEALIEIARREITDKYRKKIGQVFSIVYIVLLIISIISAYLLINSQLIFNEPFREISDWGMIVFHVFITSLTIGAVFFSKEKKIFKVLIYFTLTMLLIISLPLFITAAINYDEINDLRPYWFILFYGIAQISTLGINFILQVYLFVKSFFI